MRNVLLAASAFSSLAAALPQAINIAVAEALPTPTLLGPKDEATPAAYDPVNAAESAAAVVAKTGADLGKRDDSCSAGAATEGDSSIAAFGENSALSLRAQQATTPSGYQLSFKDLDAATEQIGYLTFKNIESGDYNVQECADFCDSEKFCLGFNIFYERDPVTVPTDSCTNPAPETNLKCSLFGYPVSKNSATNSGQFREQFQVVIGGSNGYSKLNKAMCKDAEPIEGFKDPTNLKATINAPLVTKNGAPYDPYNGMHLFNTNPYDPSLCAAACEAQTQFDKEHLVDANGEYKPCNFFASYVLTKNDVPLGTYCSFYTQAFSTEYATNTGYFYGDDVYSVICAASYELSVPDSGKIETSN